MPIEIIFMISFYFFFQMEFNCCKNLMMTSRLRNANNAVQMRTKTICVVCTHSSSLPMLSVTVRNIPLEKTLRFVLGSEGEKGGVGEEAGYRDGLLYIKTM